MANLEDIFKALGDPTRIRILNMLAGSGELCVCKIVEALGMGQPAVSHHMAVLRRAGLVDHRKSGQWIHYRLNVDALRDGPFAYIRQTIERGEASAFSNSDCASRSEENDGRVCC